jgi:hypothetical protein
MLPVGASGATCEIEALLPGTARALMWREGCTAPDDLRKLGLKRC